MLVFLFIIHMLVLYVWILRAAKPDALIQSTDEFSQYRQTLKHIITKEIKS